MLADYGDYGRIFTTLFETAVEIAKTETGASDSLSDFTLTIESYETVQEALPSQERVREADGLMISGSGEQLCDSLCYEWVN